MRLFADPKSIASEAEKLRAAESLRREDRAVVSAFINGAAPLSDGEAEALGFTVNHNNLLAYREIADSADQMFGLYTKPGSLIEVELASAPAGKRFDWGQTAAQEASRVLRKITAFKSAYQGVSGDAALHGEGLFFFPNSTFPLPKQCPLSRMLIPDDASTDVLELSHFAIERHLSLRDLRCYYDRAAEDWNKSNLGKVLARIYKDPTSGATGHQLANVEEQEYERQINSGNGGRVHRRPGVETIYFYQQRVDLPGCPYDLTIMLNAEGITDTKPDDAILFSGDAVVAGITKCLHPFFMDCIIGGAPKWHRVLGQGALNYQLNHAVELLLNRAQQATMEGSMNLWKATNAIQREDMERIVLKHNGIIPEGLEMIPNRFQANYSGIMEMIQFFRQAGSKNARGITPNNGDSNNQLEVQAVAEMNQGASATNNRTSNWYDNLDRMWSQSFERLTNPYIDKSELGYSEVMDFQNAMERAGIPLYWLQPANVTVTASRIAGDGVRHKEQEIAAYLTANRAQYAPEIQQRITRMCTGLVLGNYRLAEELTPIQEESDSPSLMRALDENAIMLTQRLPQKPKAEDIDEIHVIQHFPAMEMLIADALQFQKAAFTPQQMQSFQVIGGHVVMHVQRIEQRAMNQKNDPEREKAAQFMQHLNEIAAMGEKLANNMQQAQGGGDQEEMSPETMAKLQLEAQKLQLGTQKLQHQMEKFDRTQGTREQQMAFQQNMALTKDRRDDQNAKADLMLRDVETSVKVATAGRQSNNA